MIICHCAEHVFPLCWERVAPKARKRDDGWWAAGDRLVMPMISTFLAIMLTLVGWRGIDHSRHRGRDSATRFVKACQARKIADRDGDVIDHCFSFFTSPEASRRRRA